MSTDNSTSQKNRNPPNSLVYLFAAALVLTACITCPLGIGAGWFAKEMAGRWDKEDPKSAKPAAPSHPADLWTYQDFQDHLASKGWKTSRGIGEKFGGMWFRPGDGTPLKRDEIHDLESKIIPTGGLDKSFEFGDAFSIKDHGSASTAKSAVNGMRDVLQREDQLAWGKLHNPRLPRNASEAEKDSSVMPVNRPWAHCLVDQGQLQLRCSSHNDFQQELVAPTAASPFHDGALFVIRMLFQQR